MNDSKRSACMASSLTVLFLAASCQPAPSSNKEKGTGKDDAVATGCDTKFTGVWDQVGCFNAKTKADMECPGASLSKGLKRRIRFYENSTKATLSTIGENAVVPGLPPVKIPEDPPEKALPIDSACKVGTTFGKFPLRMEGSSLLYCLGTYCEKLTEVDAAANPPPSSASVSAECGGAQYTASGTVTGIQNNFGFAPKCAFLGLTNTLYPSLSLSLSPYGDKQAPEGGAVSPRFSISFITAKAVVGQVYDLSKSSSLGGVLSTGNLDAKYYAGDVNKDPSYHSCEGTIKFVQIPQKAGDWFEAELNIKMSAEHLQCTPGQVDKTLQGTIKLQAQKDAQY